MAQLETLEVALVAGERLVIVYRHARWHLLTLDEHGIRSLHFLSLPRAEMLITDWLPHGVLLPFEQVSPIFREELACKVLPTAEAYRPLLLNGWARMAVGYTTDTLRTLPVAEELVAAQVACIEEWMKQGPGGPFLSFTASCRRMRGQ